MQAQRLPAGQGWRWIVEGFRLFRRNPPFLTFLVFSYLLILAAANIVPVIGQLGATLVMPALWVGVLNGCRAVDRGEPVHVGLLFSGFGQNLRSLLVLGAVHIAAVMSVLALSALVDGGGWIRAMVTPPTPEGPAELGGSTVFAMYFALALLLPVLAAYWFGPLLAAWARLSAGKALFFSLVACVRNWRAFGVFVLGVALLSGVAPEVLREVAQFISSGLHTVVSVAMVMLLLFVLVPTLAACTYVSARDVFGEL